MLLLLVILSVRGFSQPGEPTAFPFRSMHLDVSRHFFSVDVVKQYIDSLAAHDFNYFHWHLTDDQGWRIEIKKYPFLTAISAYRSAENGERYGGFYTQEDIKDIVQYALLKNIQIIPEIDFPGHVSSAIAAYPQLGCTDKPIQVPSKHGIYHDILCPSKYSEQFILDVMAEVCALFPGPYIHIGGDEVPKKQWKKDPAAKKLLAERNLPSFQALQNAWMSSVATYLKSQGKSVIVWGEVTKSDFDPDWIIMSWRGKKAGIKAAKQGNRVIMASRFYCYFDYPQSRKEKKPLFYYPYLKNEKVASFNLYSKKLTDEQNAHIIGGAGMMWTEFIADEEKLWHQFTPRVGTLGKVLNSKCQFDCVED
jgi:hexosaminidase